MKQVGRHCLALLALVAPSLPAQTRTTDLTGAPQATLLDGFTAITGVRALPGDRVVVTDAREARILIADFTTGKSQQVGRRGGGPGEFQFPGILFAAPGTDSWVADPFARVLHRVSAAGKIVATQRVPSSSNALPIGQPRGTDSLGRIYFQGPPTSLLRGGQRAGVDSGRISRWDPLANRVDELGALPVQPGPSVTKVDGRTMTRSGVRPFSAAPSWLPLPTSVIAIVHPVPYRMEFIGGDGARRFGPVQPETPVKVTAKHRDAFRAFAKATSGQSAETPYGAMRRAGHIPVPDDDFPDVFPPFLGTDALLATPEGTEFWVARTTTSPDAAPTYDVFDLRGVRTGTVRLRPRSRVVGFGAGVIYVARVDPDDDLHYLEQYRR